jgi:hypothetical protein
MEATEYYYHGLAKIAAQYVIDFSPLTQSTLWRNEYWTLGPGGSMKLAIERGIRWSSGETIILNWLQAFSTSRFVVDVQSLRGVDKETRDVLLRALAILVEGTKVGDHPPLGEIQRVIKDAYYHGRDNGGTMHTCADDAAKAVAALRW